MYGERERDRDRNEEEADNQSKDQNSVQSSGYSLDIQSVYLWKVWKSKPIVITCDCSGLYP